MEGLLPLVYKRIKRGAALRHYKCLSTTGAADFYVSGFDDTHVGKYYHRRPPFPEDHRVSDVSEGSFRRSSSLPRIRHVEDGTTDPDPTPKTELGRHQHSHSHSHSHRRMFSCLTG